MFDICLNVDLPQFFLLVAAMTVAAVVAAPAGLSVSDSFHPQNLNSLFPARGVILLKMFDLVVLYIHIIYICGNGCGCMNYIHTFC